MAARSVPPLGPQFRAGGLPDRGLGPICALPGRASCTATHAMARLHQRFDRFFALLCPPPADAATVNPTRAAPDALAADHRADGRERRGSALSVQIAAATGATTWCCAPCARSSGSRRSVKAEWAASPRPMLALVQTNPPYGTENIPQIETVNQRRCRMRSS